MERILRLVDEAPVECVESAVNTLYRRVLSNLLLDFDNDKYRRIRVDSKTLKHATVGLSSELIDMLFEEVGFHKADDAYVFAGTQETLRHADEVLSAVELRTSMRKHGNVALPLLRTKRHVEDDRVIKGAPTVSADSASSMHQPSSSELGTKADFDDAAPLADVVKQTLYMSGRVRNSFFDAKHFTLRVMRHGRVYACSEKCLCDCLEAHWHHFTGRNMMYAFVAHLSPDGRTLLHTGYEHGYQYNSIPGTPNFRHTIHFNEKLVDRDGHLIHNVNMNKPVTQCVYCNMPLITLFF